MTRNTKNLAKRKLRLLTARSKGAVAVEFAVCVPILFALLFGCYELARANLMKHATESAAYEGARVGIIPGATEDEIRDATRFVLTSVGVNDFNVDVRNSVTPDDAEQVTVEVQVSFEDNFRIGTFFVTDPVFLGSCTLNRESL